MTKTEKRRQDFAHEMIVEIASLYYSEGLTQNELSDKFNVSRATIGRILRKAQEDGVVSITVQHHPTSVLELEKKLKKYFNIDRVIVAPFIEDNEMQRQSAASLASQYLDNILQDDMTLAIGAGRNVAQIATYKFIRRPVNALFISASGGTIQANDDNSNADYICRTFAAKYQARSEALYAPAYVADEKLREEIKRLNVIMHTLEKVRHADIAVIGIGDVSQDSYMVRMGWFEPEEIQQARKLGTVGDMMGYDFFDIQGDLVNIPIQGRVIGLSMQELADIPNVIAVAAERNKSVAILGALRSGVINTLITNVENIKEIIHMQEESKV
ncbi:MAG: sugar-binding transcriptional regulator [Alphaproteobacteria bacterium]